MQEATRTQRRRQSSAAAPTLSYCEVAEATGIMGASIIALAVYSMGTTR